VAFSGLARALARRDAEEIELVVLLARGDPSLESLVDASNFLLFCTPAVNLFQKRADRIHVTDESHEYHVLPDRTRPLDFEVHSVTQVVGHGLGSDAGEPFLPFYEAYSADESHRQSAYFTVRREPRLVSDTARRRGLRSNYVGTEVFLGLVDAAQAPFSGDVRQLSIETWCTNRDLPLQMAVGPGGSELTLNAAAPIASISVVIGPTRPHGPLVGGFRADQASAAVPGGETAWRAVSHLALNYLSLTESTPQEGAAALRDLLELYVPAGDVSARRQVEGIRSDAVRRVVRRLPGPGPLAFGRGLEITVHVDDLAFQGASAFLLGSVLDRYFARHVSINTFTETVMRSDARPDIGRWAQQWGTRPTL
jgi:type VI secretion system protein ImpG